MLDVQAYPQYIPFCSKCCIVDLPLEEDEAAWLDANPTGMVILADTTVGVSLLSDSFISRIRALPNKSIQVLMTSMAVHWMASIIDPGHRRDLFSMGPGQRHYSACS